MVAQRIVTSKILPSHLKLLAYIYIRQSSPKQVLENTGSTDVQREMREYALSYGFAPDNIVMVEQDQGRTATTTDRRDGFKEMLAALVSGRVGAVFCSHSSRLARASRDSQLLVQCCEVAGTLIIDRHGVYDPRNDNDRFFLGIKGVVDEAEGYRIRSQLFEARMAKARKGELWMNLPTGFIWGEDSTIQQDPDEDVRSRILYAFEQFERLGSALAVARHFNVNGLLFPTRIRKGVRGGEHVWGRTRVDRLLEIYHDPIYAGAYVYGRTARRDDIQLGETASLKHRRIPLKQEEWRVLIHNNHQGYITWEQFERIRQKLEDNCFDFERARPGAVRDGRALCQGIVMCADCNYGMSILYYTRYKSYSYACRNFKLRFSEGRCKTYSGQQVDEVVQRLLLCAFEPASIEMSLAVAMQVESQSRESLRQLDVSIKRVEADADYAYRRYLEVDPRNMRLAKRLEEDAERKFAEAERMRRKRIESKMSLPRSLTPPEQEAVLALSRDVPRVWQSHKMDKKVRKMLVRAVIKKVFLRKDGKTIHMRVLWQTGASTETSFVVRPAGEINRIDAGTLEVIKRLAPEVSDREIAKRLNEAGLTTRHGRCFDYKRVYHVRRCYNIPTAYPERERGGKTAVRGDGRISIRRLNELSGVSMDRLRHLCADGKLDAVRFSAVKGAWWIKISEEGLAELKEWGEMTAKPKQR